VYEHLDRWVKKIEVEAQTMPAGTAADDTPDPPATSAEEDETPRAAARTRLTQRPKRGGWVNRWR
jgi:hypothetical protein